MPKRRARKEKKALADRIRRARTYGRTHDAPAPDDEACIELGKRVLADLVQDETTIARDRIAAASALVQAAIRSRESVDPVELVLTSIGGSREEATAWLRSKIPGMQ